MSDEPIDPAAIKAEIIERMSRGEPLAAICRDLDVKRRRIYRWKDADPEFSEQFLDARDDGFDALAAECLEIADNTQEGVEIVERGGRPEIHTGDMLGHRKLRIETRLKLLAKWDPRRYGEKIDIEHKGGITVHIDGTDAAL